VAPTQVFEGLGGAASWSLGGTYFSFSAGTGLAVPTTTVADRSGRTIETVDAIHFIWITDEAYLGFASDGYAMHPFVGHVGSTAREPVAGSYFPGPRDIAAGGVVVLPTDAMATQYAVWTPAGLSSTRSGDPVAISRDGRFIAVDHYPPVDGSQPDQSRLDVVRTDDGSVVASYPHSYAVFGFSPDGTRLAFGPGATGGDARFFVLDTSSGRFWVAETCMTQYAVWLDGSHLIVNSQTPCGQPAGSGVTIETTPDWSMAVSSDGKLASVTGQGTPTSSVETIDVAIQSASVGREGARFTGWDMSVRLSWAPDGSLLLVSYVGPGSSSPPSHVVLLRP